VNQHRVPIILIDSKLVNVPSVLREVAVAQIYPEKICIRAFGEIPDVGAEFL
jgi:hypothetical protein